MTFLRCVHIHLGNILYQYGCNHDLDNKVICIYMTRGCEYGARRNFRNEIHLTKILRCNKMNFEVVCHKIHYHLN